MKTFTIIHERDVPVDWRDRLVVLWLEDDVNYPDKESTAQAFTRITKMSMRERPVKILETDGTFVSFYRGGWVTVVACDYGCVGVLVTN